MKEARAPAGFHTVVNIMVVLDVQPKRVYSASWVTPIALAPALHKAPRWVKTDMQTDKIPGRSKIVAITVAAKYVRGSY